MSMTTSRRRVRVSVHALAALSFACGASTVFAQTGPNIVRIIRPLVNVQASGSIPGSTTTAMGIFDTGGFGLFIPPETNTIWNIPATAATAAGSPNDNYGIVGQGTSFAVGGYLGGTFGGPEGVNTPPVVALGKNHTFATAGNFNEIQRVTRTNILPSLTYFNTGGGAKFSEPNIGAAFYNGTATTDPLVAVVDPINASWLPFASGDSSVAGIARASVPLDQVTTSISFLTPRIGANANPAVPTPTKNANPDFLFTIPLGGTDRAGNAMPAATPFRGSAAASAAANNATQGYRPTATITPALAATIGPAIGGPRDGTLFVPAGGASVNRVIDTGAPTSGTTLFGTDYLNGYGQYWDFNTAQLLMFGPRRDSDKQLISTGMLMNVDRATTGLTRTAVNRYALDGLPGTHVPVGGPGLNPGNPLNANGLTRYGRDATGVGPGEQATVIYRAHMTHSNAGYIDGITALGLKGVAQAGAPGDQIDGLSVGADRAAPQLTLFFSVDRDSQGLLGSSQGFGGGVLFQALRGQQAGDVFQSFTGSQGKAVGRNSLRFNQDLMGLGADVGPETINTSGSQDNLKDFDLRAIEGYNGAAASGVMRNIDPVIRRPETAANTFNPGKNVTSSGGTVNPLGDRTDLYGTNFRTYFSLDATSPSLAPNNVSPADILVNRSDATGWKVFATAVQAGLRPDDDIDAVALSRFDPGALFDLVAGTVDIMTGPPGYLPLASGGEGFGGIDAFNGLFSDVLLFSLSPTSPSLAQFEMSLGRFLSPADVFITDFDGTFALFASAESLGLDPATDNIDGLDTLAIPEPGTAACLVPALLLLARRRRHAAVRAIA